MKLLSRREDDMRQFAAPIIIGTAAIGLVLAAAVPQIGRIRADRQALNQAAAAAGALETKVAGLQAIDAAAQAGDLLAAAGAVPLTQPYIQSFRLVETLSLRHGLAMSQLKFGTETDALSLGFMISGPMGGIQNFLEDVNRALPLSAAARVETTRSAGGEIYLAAAEIKIYFKPAPETIGRAADPMPVMTAQLAETLRRLNEFERIGPAETEGEETTAAEPAGRLFPP